MNAKTKILFLILIFFIKFPVLLFSQNYINNGGKGKSIAFEESLTIKNGRQTQNSYYSTVLKTNLTQVFVVYSAITVVASDNEREIIDIQRKSQDSRHSDSSAIEAGNLIAQMYTAQSTIEFSANTNFRVSINIRNNKTGGIEASAKVGPYSNEEEFHNYAANDIGLRILPQLGVELSSLAKSNLSYRKNNNSESLVDARKHYSNIVASIENIDKELSVLTKTQMDKNTAIAQKASLEAAKKQLEIQQREANERIKRLEDDERRREEDKKNSLLRTTQLNKKIENNGIKFDKLANQKRTELAKNMNVDSKLRIIEKKKQTLLDLRNETAEKIKIYNEQENKDASEKVKLIENQEYSSIEKDANGKITKEAKNERKQKINQIRLEAEQRKKEYQEKQIASKQDADDAIRTEIISDIEELSKEQKENSLINSNLLRFGNYDGSKKGWVAYLNLIVAGKEISTEQILIPYNKITNLNPNYKTQEEKIAYNSVVEEYNSYFACNIPIIYTEINYKIKPHPNGYPSQYQIDISSYTFKNLESDEIVYETSAKVKNKTLSLTPSVDVKLNSGLSQYEFDNFVNDKKNQFVNFMNDSADFLSQGYIILSADIYFSKKMFFGLNADYLFPLKYFDIGPSLDFLISEEQIDFIISTRLSKNFSLFEKDFYGATNLGIDLFTVEPNVSFYLGFELGYYFSLISENDFAIHTKLDFSSQYVKFDLGGNFIFK